MRDIWYADNRDLIKWGVLFRLAERYEAADHPGGLLQAKHLRSN